MRKLKTQVLLLLLTVLTTQASYAQASQASKEISENEFGIDLASQYEGTEVLEMLQILTDEAEKSIEEAYEKGYKQGVLAYKPLADRREYEVAYLEREIKSLKNQRWLFMLGGAAGGFIVGGVSGAAFGVSLRLQQ